MHGNDVSSNPVSSIEIILFRDRLASMNSERNSFTVVIPASLHGLDRVFFFVKPNFLMQVPTKDSETDIPKTSRTIFFKTVRVMKGLFIRLCLMNATRASVIFEGLLLLLSEVPCLLELFQRDNVEMETEKILDTIRRLTMYL